VDGDLSQCLDRLLSAARALRGTRILGRALRAVPLAVRLGVIGPRPPAPVRGARLSGRVHSRERDRAAIEYHYDLSNEFYELILDPAMAYSCGYWSPDAPLRTLARAQHDKLELICAKLGLRPGMRLLDVGCGWGSLVVHAARAHGVRVTGVTLAEQQRRYVAARAEACGLGDLIDVRLQDYRDVADGPYDAVAAVEMGEHVGAAQYPRFAAQLHALVRPGGRLLVQQMSRGQGAPGGGAFIETYIAGDMHMRPLGGTVALLAGAGFEILGVEAMREHYPPTIRAWLSALEGQWARATELVGEPTARIWRLYLAGGALAFADRRMGVDQILAARP
jgi:cyclopropane-fatty-acyl-phospholipid synthase